MLTLSELVAGTSHELNNPLAIVTGYADLLLEDGALTTDQRSKVESIRKNALRASSVVHSLLAFARKRKPERVRTDVNGVIVAAADLKEYDLSTNGIAFEKVIEPNLASVFADPNQILQVLLNIINNAQDAVSAGTPAPKIVVRSESRGDSVVIIVEDNGSGITKMNLKKVFDPFFTTKPVGKGTGLGLSISYGIIREHNGEITIRSEVGKGTQVLIELPVDKEVEAPKKIMVPTPLLRSMRILVVDDEIEIVSILRSGLTRPGVTVDSACTVKDAVSLAGTITYDYVITDVNMPGGSGIDLYRQLCNLNPLYRHRTVFLTGDTSNASVVQYLKNEGLTHFPKPFDFDEMNQYLKENRDGAL
jgi:CheY-like chemotaxis protein